MAKRYFTATHTVEIRFFLRLGKRYKTILKSYQSIRNCVYLMIQLTVCGRRGTRGTTVPSRAGAAIVCATGHAPSRTASPTAPTVWATAPNWSPAVRICVPVRARQIFILVLLFEICFYMILK